MNVSTYLINQGALSRQRGLHATLQHSLSSTRPVTSMIRTLPNSITGKRAMNTEPKSDAL